jgi:hypothetical protein
VCPDGKVIVNGISALLNALRKEMHVPDNKKKDQGGKKNQPKEKAPDENPLTPEDVGGDVGGLIGGSVAGKTGDAVGKLAGKGLVWLVEQIDWKAVLEALDKAIDSSWKKDKIEGLLTLSISVSHSKMLLIVALSPDGIYKTKDPVKAGQLRTKLEELQTLIAAAKKILTEEKDDYKDEANKKIKEIEKLIGEVQQLEKDLGFK